MTEAALQCLYFTVVNSEGTKSVMINAALNEPTSDKSFMSTREILGCYKRSTAYPTLSSSGQFYPKILLCMYWQLLPNYNEAPSQKGKLNKTIKVNPYIIT